MRPALLLIDVQNEYFRPHGQWPLPAGEEALANIHLLLAGFRLAHLPVFHIVHERLDPASPVFRPGTIGAAIHPAIDIHSGEYRIRKHFPGSFSQTALEAYLRREEVDTLAICGFMTHMCCDTTTRQASERGLAVWFASDATAARDLELEGGIVPHSLVHRATLAVMTRFATVLPAAGILERLGGSGSATSPPLQGELRR